MAFGPSQWIDPRNTCVFKYRHTLTDRRATIKVRNLVPISLIHILIFLSLEYKKVVSELLPHTTVKSKPAKIQYDLHYLPR